MSEPAQSVDIAGFYDRHPYPPPLQDLSNYEAKWSDGEGRRRVDHHLMWPATPYRDDLKVLIAGCGTSQAAKYAIRYPNARVVGIDVSLGSIQHSEFLARQHRLDNMEVRQLGIDSVHELGENFDLIVSTGVLHHMADPGTGLRALRNVVEPGGAIQLMVYATYGRTGVYMIQDYCRRLGVGHSSAEIADVVSTLRELPNGHPIRHVLSNSPDFQDDHALADALLHPQDRSYTVPELLDLVQEANLRFGRWIRQAPYLPVCGSLADLPHGQVIAAMPEAEQFAATELFRGTMVRHNFIAYPDDETSPTRSLDALSSDGWEQFVPIALPTVASISERLPAGAAAALLNTAHEFPDLVMFASPAEKNVFDAIDGERTIASIPGADPQFFRRLWQHDLVVFDTSRAGSS